MAVLDSIAKQANRLASDVQMSLRRARVEGERRLLQRQHRAALEELGERAYELVRAGQLPEEPLATEIGAVESGESPLPRYRERCATLGAAVRVATADGVVTGRAIDLDPTGALVVEGGDGDGDVRVLATGEVLGVRPETAS